MRWLACLAMAGCYNPHSELACAVTCGGDAGFDGNPDALGDAMTDGPVSLACPLFTFTASSSLNQAAVSYTTNSSNIAIFDASGQILEAVAGSNDGTSSVVTFTPAVAMGAIRFPRLAPQGNEMFSVAMIGGNRSLASSTRSGPATWTAPIAVLSNLPAISADFTLGSPTATASRLMMAGVSNSNAFLEGVESSGSWTFTPLDMTPFAALTMRVEPSLSSDGLQLVFVGRDGAAGVIALYLATRPDLATKFGAPVLLANNPDGNPGTETTPSFNPTCGHVFVSLDSPSRVLELH